ncbi:MAG TPA: PilZ domain-containing protein [Polyangia bacterium]
MLATKQTKPAVDFDAILDAAPAAANDVGRAPLRSLPRWALCATLDGDSLDGLYAGLSYDVASGGVFVATWDMPPVGERVYLLLTLPDGGEVELGGVVRWVRDESLAGDGLPAGCGVECKGMPVDVLRALQAFAAEREPTLWLAELA